MNYFPNEAHAEEIEHSKQLHEVRNAPWTSSFFLSRERDLFLREAASPDNEFWLLFSVFHRNSGD